jgi:transcription-repair coupling factor (superfamily II helicase)
VIIDVNAASDAAQGLWNNIAARHEQLRHDRQRPILDPAELYLTPAEFQQHRDALPRVHLRHFEWPAQADAGDGIPVQNFASTAPATVRIDARLGEPAAALAAHLQTSPARVLIAAESAGRRELLLDLLRGRGIAPSCSRVSTTSWRASAGSASR